MASISATTGGLSSTSTLRGVSGLASGLDRDTLIEQMTSGTRTKIENEKKKQDKLGWEQTALREVIDKAYNYTSKYTSYASSSNLTSSTLFSRTDITAVGDNSKYISVSGKASSADLFTIAGVKQLAQDAKINGKTASESKLKTGALANDLTTTFDQNMVAGKSLSIKYGNTNLSVVLGTGDEYDYSDIAEALNKSFEQVDINNDGKTLADVMQATVGRDGRITFINTDKAGNSIEIKGGSQDVLEYLGFLDTYEDISDLDENALVIGAGRSITGKNENSVLQETQIGSFLSRKSFNFTYNGVSKTITIDANANLRTINDLAKHLESKLGEAFGTGRISVSAESIKNADKSDSGTSNLVFKTTTPDGKDDASSILTLNSASTGILGKNTGLFKVAAGTSNRVNLDSKILDSGLAGVDEKTKQEVAVLKINGVEIQGVSWDSTVEDIIKAVNDNKQANVTISYQKNSDRFVISSNEKGASGQVKLEGNVAGLLFGKELFIKRDSDGDPIDANGSKINDLVADANRIVYDYSQAVTQEGKDAIIGVKYAGEDTIVEINRDTNSFTLDGLTVGVKKAFGYDQTNGWDEDAEVTFDAKVDAENTTKIVKEMIEAFNDILTTVNDYVKTKPDRDYDGPLTASQKEDMTESEIEAYEEKAKQGILFADSDLRMFADALRFIIPTTDIQALEEIGITESTDYSDNGKLSFDEAAFKAALESNPEKVKELFTRTTTKDENGKTIQGGFMEQISKALKQYAGTTGAVKGILVERAGSVHAPTSILQNTIQDEMDEIDDYIDRLLDKLEKEEDRYISQFTTLESLISQMNSQSGYIAQLSGGY